MYDPENKEDRPKRKNLLEKPAVPPKPVIIPTIMDEETKFRFYVEEFASFREALGVRVDGGKIEVIDASALSKLSETQRTILRDVCRRLVQEYNQRTNKYWVGGLSESEDS